ncbi:uncharacterized protein LOC122033975 [Zingiber officinale]|uniref:uncharacterized protein LOC122033975 n=1 Tax=Zingiber officinale TaxID=94328 RepID=UPI001C4DD58C|nr:uncharacterized protein LOC122033975 [Zingiber officinale]
MECMDDHLAVERWRENAEKARSNRNTEPGGPSTGIAQHTSGSKYIVKHAMDLEHDLARQPTCMEVFLKTHKKKDESFVDSRSLALHEQMTERVAQASQPPSEGEESQSLSTDTLNKIYYDVVGGRTKKSTLYDLGSRAKVAFDRLRTPRDRASSSSSSEVRSLRRKNEELRTQLKSMDERMASMDQWRAEQDTLFTSMRQIVTNFAYTQTPHGPESQETQDPSDRGD